tara:strand:- start:43 stop:1761 length:1719 start_codon:yes stop_codon:yes gene_type:complete
MAIIYTYPVKPTPNDDDLILISDSEDSNKTKQVKISTLPGGSGSGVSSVTATLPLASTGGGTPVISLTGLTGFGTTGQVIKVNSNADGLEWGTAGGSTSPDGPDHSVQYKDGSSFAGSGDLTFHSTNNLFSVKHTVIVKGQGNGNPAGRLKLNCEQDSHAITLEGPAHSGGADYTLKLPSPAPSNQQILQSDGSGVLSWINTPSSGGGGAVDSVNTTDGTYIDLTPNAATTGAVTVTADLSAIDGTSDTSTKFLSKDNTWDVPSYTTNTTYEIMGSGNSYAAGLVLAGGADHQSNFLRKDGTWATPTNTEYTGSGGVTLTGTNFTNSDRGSSQSIFKNIAVSGQSTVVADSNNDTLNLIAGSNITLTTNATNDSVTINSSGGGVSETSGVWYATLANSSGQSYASNATQAQITITTNNCQWRRVGDMIHYQFYIAGTIKGTASGSAGTLQGELFLCQTETSGATSSTTYGLPINSTLGNTLVDDGFCNGSLVMTETEAPQQALTWAYPVNGGRIGRDTNYPGYVELCSLLNSGTASKLYYPNSAIVWITNTSEEAGNWALGGTLSAMVTHTS